MQYEGGVSGAGFVRRLLGESAVDVISHDVKSIGRRHVDRRMRRWIGSRIRVFSDKNATTFPLAPFVLASGSRRYQTPIGPARMKGAGGESLGGRLPPNHLGSER